MPIVTVSKVGQTRTGKPCVWFNGEDGYDKAVYLGKKTESPPVGAVIDADTVSSDFQGKTYWYLNGWTPSKGQPTTPATPVADPAQSPPGTAHIVTYTRPNGGWDIQSGDLSRFVSNVVGQAILAGLIKKPDDIHPWVYMAYKAGEGMRTGDRKYFEDSVPF